MALLETLEPTLPPGIGAGDLRGWSWDCTAVETVVATALHVLRLGLELTAPSEAEAGDVRAELLSRLADLRGTRRSLRLLRRREMAYWRRQRARTVRAALVSDGPGPAPGPALRAWAAESVGGRPAGAAEAVRAELFAMASEAAEAVVAVRGDLRRVAAGAIGHDWGDDATASLLLDMLDRLSPLDRGEGEGDDVERTLRRLLALVVVESALAGGEPVVEQLVELMQISAEAPNAFDERDTGPEKLAGLQLGHFGAFYKRSWRANDWMWGRLDAVPSLLRVLLNPARLRHLAANDPSFASELGERIRRLALAEDDPETAEALRPAWDEAAVRQELAFVGDPTRPLPVGLPACTAALMRRMQLAILQEELPCVAAAVRTDLLSGATDRGDARAFLEAVHAAQAGAAPPAGDPPAPTGSSRPGAPRRIAPPEVREDLPLAPAAAARLLEACRVGRERFSEESESHLYLSTVNAATAVGLRAVQRHVGSSAPERRRRASIRRSWPAVSPVIGSMAARSARVLLAMAVLLTAGAALLAVGLRGADPGVWATVAGSLCMAGGAVLAVARTRPGLRAVPIAAAAVAAVLLALSLLLPGRADVRSGAFRTAVEVGLAVLLAVIGGGVPPGRRSKR